MFNKPEIGSLEWARQTDGLLASRYDRVQMVMQMARLLIGEQA